jgi:hypothetical protein
VGRVLRYILQRKREGMLESHLEEFVSKVAK